MKEAELRAAGWLPRSQFASLTLIYPVCLIPRPLPARQEGSLPLCRWNPIHPLLCLMICG